jgi:hypothetical protein
MMKIFVLIFCLSVHCGEISVVVKTILWDLVKTDCLQAQVSCITSGERAEGCIVRAADDEYH